MNWNKLWSFAGLYALGLLASSWNAGISAVKINGGVTLAAAAAPKLLSAPDLKTMVGIFVAAAFWEAIDFFDENKIPVVLPPSPPAS